MKINPDDYEKTAECIRSGQVPDADIVAIMDEDTEFRAWYLTTVNAKHKIQSMSSVRKSAGYQP